MQRLRSILHLCILFCVVLVLSTGCSIADNTTASYNYSISSLEDQQSVDVKMSNKQSPNSFSIDYSTSSSIVSNPHQPQTTPVHAAININILTSYFSMPTEENIIYKYGMVLGNQSAFIEMNYNGDVFFSGYLVEYLTKYFDTFSMLDFPGGFIFTVLDMNDDSMPELVLSAIYPDMVLVLSYDEGFVYGSLYSNKQMNDIKVDGTYRWLGGLTYGWRKALLHNAYDDQDLCTYAFISSVNPVDGTEQTTEVYIVEGNDVTMEAFYLYENAIEMKDDAIWHEMSDLFVETGP